ncbi:HEAT repeat-containing protein 4 isoform X1 [Lates calcarifer]|uniref:HEAT repeat-containing protein 4 isoform X1 n=1 Tax=Lates calcarifer TaxID=8187 RepID=A0AAJ7VBL7_LATCA|nr:HEAT repeat-containing protein 4 isoform X1 [Lates calcarifer]XP_018545388.1 HEAT repeat-containing protein 4 isoform X1 [Lates calcarifer]XP_018545391.1 HEAT repeat-containing protein 4 isoform X1 [Lates calcarifer]
MDPHGAVSGSASIHSQRSQLLYQRFLSDAAAGLTFSPDTESGTDRVSYSQADFRHLFRPTGVLRPVAKRPVERRHYRASPRLKHQLAPGSRLLPLLPESPESVDHSDPQRTGLLQDSCRRTRGTEVQPVHKGAHKTQIIFKDSNYTRNLQRRSHPDLKNRTTHTPKKSLNRDLNDLQDQDQTGRRQSDSAGSDPDGWVAAQSEVLDGDHSRGVIQRLLAQLFHDDQPEDLDQPPDVQSVVSQLVYLSNQTPLVRSLLAEQLNSAESRTRLLACTTLSRLKGPVNKDVVQKLIHLMWNDHSDPVRLAAAETLMKLGKVQDVHNQIRLKLEDVRGLQGRTAALNLLSSLKLTTATLLESVVSCFRDEFSAVRKQACETAASLLLKEETVVSRLLERVENDPVRQVRRSALTAVGALGLSSADVQETLQCCVETEDDAELRLAACRLLQSVDMPADKLLDFLLQRVNTESDRQVRRTMQEMLRLCDRRRQEDGCDDRFVSLQVKRLCGCRDVTDKLLLLEKLDDGKHQGRRLHPGTLSRLLSLQSRTDEDRISPDH